MTWITLVVRAGSAATRLCVVVLVVEVEMLHSWLRLEFGGDQA